MLEESMQTDIDRLRKWHRAITNKIVWGHNDSDIIWHMASKGEIPEGASLELLMWAILEQLDCCDKIEEVQRLILSAVLSKYKYNFSRGADFLGLPRSTFRERCRVKGLLDIEDNPEKHEALAV